MKNNETNEKPALSKMAVMGRCFSGTQNLVK